MIIPRDLPNAIMRCTMHAARTGVRKSRVAKNISRNGKLIRRHLHSAQCPQKKRKTQRNKEYRKVLLINNFHLCLHLSSYLTAWHSRKTATDVARERWLDGAGNEADGGPKGRDCSFPASVARRKQTGTPWYPRCLCLSNWPRHR